MRRLAPAGGSKPPYVPLPPQDMQLGVGVATAERYLQVGRNLREDILSRAGTPPTGRILDIGCGSGRIARHFVDHIRRPGRYVGMDIQKRFVDWCEKSITPVNPAFRFYHQDIHNGHYNPEGKYRASEYRFPFEDGSFDLIILTSVFTHMLPEDASNYLKEISRLLAPGGYCYCTWFLLGHDVDVKYLRREVKEAQVGYGFRYCMELLKENGLALAGEPSLGKWHGGEGPTGQDVLLLGRAQDTRTSAFAADETARVPEGAQPEEVSASVRSVDPVRHGLVLTVGEGRETVRIAVDAKIAVNGRDADSSALRQEQAGRLRVHRPAGDGPSVASVVEVRDRPQTEQVRGIVENVDPESGTLTLYSGGAFKTFEIDPKSASVRVDGKDVGLAELREGHRASLRYVNKVEAVSSTDPSRKRGA